MGAGRDFAAGLSVVVDERDGVGDSERDGEGDGGARSDVLAGAIDYDMDMGVTVEEKERRSGEAL